MTRGQNQEVKQEGKWAPKVILQHGEDLIIVIPLYNFCCRV